MPYNGNQLATQFQAFVTQTITGDGSTGYTLDRAVANGKELLVYINNVKQEEGSGKSYTASGTTITFSAAVASTDSCYVVFLGSAVQTVAPPDGSVSTAKLASGAITSAVLPTGSVLQVVSTTKTDHFETTNTSFTDITGMSVSITPSSSSNKILVMTNVFASHGDAAVLQALRDSTVIGSGDDSDSTSTKRGFAMVRESATNLGAHYNLTHLDSPSTTSSTTYKIQLKSDSSGTVKINGRAVNDDYATSSSITVMEIAG